MNRNHITWYTFISRTGETRMLSHYLFHVVNGSCHKPNTIDELCIFIYHSLMFNIIHEMSFYYSTILFPDVSRGLTLSLLIRFYLPTNSRSVLVLTSSQHKLTTVDNLLLIKKYGLLCNFTLTIIRQEV